MQLVSRRFDCPLAEPLGTADGAITRREGWLVAVHADGRTLGVGEAAPLAGWTESHAACGDGLDATNVTRGRLPPGESPAARHAVTVALRDAFARRRGESLAASLLRDSESGTPAERVAVNATIGDGDTEETVAAARAAVDAGFETIKLKIGAREPAADLDRVRRVAERLPADVRLRADANGAYDRETARRVLTALDGLVEYVEQPVSATDLAGLSALKGVGPAVAADESIARAGPWHVLAADAADVIVCKPMALGGPERTLAVARAARARGVRPVVTTTIDAVIARTAAVHVASVVDREAVGRTRAHDERTVAHGLATGDRLAREPTGADGAPLVNPVPVENGTIDVPSDPGLAGGRLDWR